MTAAAPRAGRRPGRATAGHPHPRPTGDVRCTWAQLRALPLLSIALGSFCKSDACSSGSKSYSSTAHVSHTNLQALFSHLLGRAAQQRQRESPAQFPSAAGAAPKRTPSVHSSSKRTPAPVKRQGRPAGAAHIDGHATSRHATHCMNAHSRSFVRRLQPRVLALSRAPRGCLQPTPPLVRSRPTP